MNCKPGDLAVVIKDPYCNNADVGRIVEVVCLDPEDPSEWECSGLGSPLAFVAEGSAPRPGCVSIPDAWLRPIRDQPGADEALTWAGKPQSIPKETV